MGRKSQQARRAHKGLEDISGEWTQTAGSSTGQSGVMSPGVGSEATGGVAGRTSVYRPVTTNSTCTARKEHQPRKHTTDSVEGSFLRRKTQHDDICPTNNTNNLIGYDKSKSNVDLKTSALTSANSHVNTSRLSSSTETITGKVTFPNERKHNVNKCIDKGRSNKPVGINQKVLAMFGVCVVLSLGTRLYKIDWPPHICWDETHFGKMGSWYINRTFFFDVHPPLGKMLIGLSGSLTGYNGSFPFSKPGVKYGDVPYVGMRVFCASLGAALGPLCFGCTWELTHSLTASVLSSSLVIFDTGLLTLSQYILLDPILLFFIMSGTYSLLRFLNQQHSPFCLSWWTWLIMTGVFLACSIGVKFVGLFVILLAGFSTVRDLWHLLGDLSLSVVEWVKHLLARAACLIVLPVLLYLVFFAIHFHRLNRSGSGDGFYSSAFQSQLQGNPLYDAHMPAEVAYGSVVTLKNHRTGGAYLHSHLHLYPEGKGARQQQVTTYGHKDENNQWVMKRFNRRLDPGEEPELVVNGDLVRLEHVSTRRNLHSHRLSAPLTPKHFQVTCYGNDGEGDYNDVFRLEIVGVKGHAALHTVRSVFRLVHASIDCALSSHNKQLPKWGWEQMEVTCNPNIRDRKALWNIEQVIDPRLPNKSFTVYAPSFLENVLESHVVMAQGNSGLKPKEGEVTSRPWQWPINYRGQPFSGGDKRVYLLGNPIIWWSSLVAMATFLVMYAYHAVRRQRRCQEDDDVRGYRDQTFGACGWLLAGWFLHYAPFWTMSRVLYFHHYFPALLYSFMLTGIIWDYVIARLSGLFRPSIGWSVYHVLTGAALSVIVYSFCLFRPLSYGMSGPLAADKDSVVTGLRWLESWEI